MTTYEYRRLAKKIRDSDIIRSKEDVYTYTQSWWAYNAIDHT